MTRAERCPACGGDAFRVVGPSLACAACGAVLPDPAPDELAELRREVATLREDVARLRRAVNFLHQRVR